MEMQNALWKVILSTDLATKFILVILLFMSILCWAITIYKIIYFRYLKESLYQASHLLNNVTGIEDLHARISTIKFNLAGKILSQHFIYFNKILKNSEDLNKPISNFELDVMKEYIFQVADEVIDLESEFLPILSTSAQASPLIGLFGTVWGLIHSFLEIAQQQSADIAAVAPGIAEALITTLAGLVVAIPSLIMFNYIQNKLKVIDQSIITLSEKSFYVFNILSYKINRRFDSENSNVLINNISKFAPNSNMINN